MRFAVLGGAGSMGRIIVRDLIEFANAGDEVLVADYDLSRAQAVVDALPKRKGLAVAAQVDVRDAAQAKRALAGSFVVINSVQYQLNLEVMQLALDVGAHYVDLGGLFHVTRQQLEWNERFQRAGLIALLGMGAAPGITNVLAAEACSRFERVQEIHLRVAGVDLTRYASAPALPVSYSLQTILEELSTPPAVFTRGKFEFVEPMSGESAQRFPPPVGRARPFHTLHSEVATLPLSYAELGVREVSFQIAFNPEFLAKVKFLRDLGLASSVAVKLGDVEVKPIELVNRVAMAQPRPVPKGRLRQHEVVRAVVKGFEPGKKKATWVFDCLTAGMPKWGVGTDIDTGSPPAIAARMLASGEISGHGTLAPELAIPPRRFFAELKRRGMRIQSRRHSGWGFPV